MEEREIHTSRFGPPSDTLGKLCKCHGCGTVRKHTVKCDFFIFFADPERRLYCERCFWGLALAGQCRDVLEVEIDDDELLEPSDIVVIDEYDGEDEDDEADWWKR